MKTLSRSPFPLQSFFELSLHLFIYPVSARSTRNEKKKKEEEEVFLEDVLFLDIIQIGEQKISFTIIRLGIFTRKKNKIEYSLSYVEYTLFYLQSNLCDREGKRITPIIYTDTKFNAISLLHAKTLYHGWRTVYTLRLPVPRSKQWPEPTAARDIG